MCAIDVQVTVHLHNHPIRALHCQKCFATFERRQEFNAHLFAQHSPPDFLMLSTTILSEPDAVDGSAGASPRASAAISIPRVGRPKKNRMQPVIPSQGTMSNSTGGANANGSGNGGGMSGGGLNGFGSTELVAIPPSSNNGFLVNNSSNSNTSLVLLNNYPNTTPGGVNSGTIQFSGPLASPLHFQQGQNIILTGVGGMPLQGQTPMTVQTIANPSQLSQLGQLGQLGQFTGPFPLTLATISSPISPITPPKSKRGKMNSTPQPQAHSQQTMGIQQIMGTQQTMGIQQAMGTQGTMGPPTSITIIPAKSMSGAGVTYIGPTVSAFDPKQQPAYEFKQSPYEFKQTATAYELRQPVREKKDAKVQCDLMPLTAMPGTATATTAMGGRDGTASGSGTAMASGSLDEKDALGYQDEESAAIAWLEARLAAAGRLHKCPACEIVFYDRGLYFLHKSMHKPTEEVAAVCLPPPMPPMQPAPQPALAQALGACEGVAVGGGGAVGACGGGGGGARVGVGAIASAGRFVCSICERDCNDRYEFAIHFINAHHPPT